MVQHTLGVVRYGHIPCTLGRLFLLLLLLACCFALLLELQPPGRGVGLAGEHALNAYFCIFSCFFAAFLLMGAGLSSVAAGWGGVAASPACCSGVVAVSAAAASASTTAGSSAMLCGKYSE